MKIHYYSGWFDEALPAKYLEALKNDITDKKSLVLIWGCWAGDDLIDFVRDKWLAPGGIVFDEISLVDNRMPKEEGQKLIKEASALLLLGGDDIPQAEFIKEYELAAPIKESNGNIIMGFSAGAINMPSTCINFEDGRGGKMITYRGLGLDDFSYIPYFKPDMDGLPKDDIFALSEEMDIYATTPESFFRVKGGEVEVFGDVYLFSGSKMEKL